MLDPATCSVRLIVAATDLSPSADRAIEQAAMLAGKWGAELCLLHVFDDGVWATIKAIYAAESWADCEPTLAARNQLSQQARELSSRHDIDVRADTRTGRAAGTIAEFVREQQAQLLVVGEHAEDLIGDNVVGGTALKVLEKASVPVMLVRRPASADFSVVITATDFSDNARRAARWAVALFPESRHHLLHAYHVAFEGRMRMAGASNADIERYRDDELARAEARVAEQAAELDFPHAPGRLLVRGSPAAALFTRSEKLQADLIVIGKHGGSVLEARLLGSVTQNVLYHANCNVLLVP